MENTKKKLSKKTKIIITAVVVIVAAVTATAAVMLYNPLKLKKDTVTVEFGQPISTEASTYLKKDVDKDIVKNTKVTYKAKPVEGQEYDQVGDYTITLKHENKKKEVTVKIEDTTKPEFNATADAGIETIEGVELKFEELITATDLSGAEVTFENIDEVDLNKAGEYTLKAVAKDKSGNTAKKDIKVTVAEKPANMTGSDVSVDSETGKVTVKAKTYTPSNNGSSGGSGKGSSSSSGSSGGKGSVEYNGSTSSGEIDSGRTWESTDWMPLPEGW